MSLWERIKRSFSGGVESISDKTTEWSAIAKLKWENHGIKKDVEKSLTELGDMVYQLHTEGKDDQILAESKGLVQQIEAFEERLAEKEEEIRQLTEKGVNPHQLKELRKDLELGDGAIDQIVIAEDSKMIGKKLMEINFPDNVLIGAIVRDDKVIIPDGQTVVQEGDKLTLIGEKDDVEVALSLF
ncbi:MAG: TrkA C-terminal domain-containing protein [candidate division KSB1 bacterium]|nr:TrkA C-terminal domain-containing protein [candidate division KSB1 bacterium]